jgi:tripartite-type tricarboxylate transporter receptor subunit TctC
MTGMYRHFLVATTWMLLAAASGVVHAQSDFPSRPIEVIVPYPSGGGVAAMARAFAAEASREMGQQWVVINRDGAGGAIGFSALAKAKPDGYTIVFSPASPMTNVPFISAAMPFRNDQIEPVCQIFENVFAIAVRPDSPVRSLADLLTRARAAPGAVSYGHGGPASVGHLSTAIIERAAKVRFNAIPYRGDGPVLADLLGGQVEFAALGVGTLSGKSVRVLAVLSQKRHPALPEVPSVTELGLPANSQGLNGLYVPVGTPRSVAERYEAVCRTVTTSAIFAERARAMSQVISYQGGHDFKLLIDRTYKIHEGLVPDLKLEKN